MSWIVLEVSPLAVFQIFHHDWFLNCLILSVNVLCNIFKKKILVDLVFKRELINVKVSNELNIYYSEYLFTDIYSQINYKKIDIVVYRENSYYSVINMYSTFRIHISMLRKIQYILIVYDTLEKEISVKVFLSMVTCDTYKFICISRNTLKSY